MQLTELVKVSALQLRLAEADAEAREKGRERGREHNRRASWQCLEADSRKGRAARHTVSTSGPSSVTVM